MKREKLAVQKEKDRILAQMKEDREARKLKVTLLLNNLMFSEHT
jgi:hypothetical protein